MSYWYVLNEYYVCQQMLGVAVIRVRIWREQNEVVQGYWRGFEVDGSLWTLQNVGPELFAVIFVRLQSKSRIAVQSHL